MFQIHFSKENYFPGLYNNRMVQAQPILMKISIVYNYHILSDSIPVSPISASNIEQKQSCLFYLPASFLYILHHLKLIIYSRVEAIMEFTTQDRVEMHLVYGYLNGNPPAAQRE